MASTGGGAGARGIAPKRRLILSSSSPALKSPAAAMMALPGT